LIKRLREEWLYWRFRNITRRRQLLQARLRTRLRRQPSAGRAFRARGTAVYMPTRSSYGRGLLFVAAAAAVLALVDYVLGAGLHPPFLVNTLLLAGLAYAYIRTGNV
jgi:hypothetical protein